MNVRKRFVSPRNLINTQRLLMATLSKEWLVACFTPQPQPTKCIEALKQSPILTLNTLSKPALRKIVFATNVLYLQRSTLRPMEPLRFEFIMCEINRIPNAQLAQFMVRNQKPNGTAVNKCTHYDLRFLSSYTPGFGLIFSSSTDM